MQDWKELVSRFANQIRYDCHGMTVRFSRSEAGQELRAHGTKDTIAIIGAHLEAQPAADLSTVEGDVNIALAMLLHSLGRRLGIFIPDELVFGDRAGWIAWAKRVVT